MTTVNEETLVNEGSIPPDDFHSHIERMQEIADYEIELLDSIRDRLEAEVDGLLVAPDPEALLDLERAVEDDDLRDAL